MTEWFKTYLVGEQFVYEPMSDEEVVQLFGALVDVHTEPLSDGSYKHTLLPRSDYEFPKDLDANNAEEPVA